MGADKGLEAHHAAPRCLLRLHERANDTNSPDGEAIQAWLEWEWEAMRWRVPVEISRGELEKLVEKSAELLERQHHRLLHQSDWQRWGSRGGRETVRRYGNSWMALLTLKRWGRITSAAKTSGRSRPVRGCFRPTPSALMTSSGSSPRRTGPRPACCSPRSTEVVCSECGREESAMKTVYWPEEGDWAEEWPLCEECYEEVADEVLVVPGPYSVWGWCNSCKDWHSLNDMTKWSGGGPHSAPQGVCRACAM